MIGRLAALIVLGTLPQTVPHQIPLAVVERGDDFFMTCPIIGDTSGMFYLYKLKFGFMVEILASGTISYKIILRGEFDNSRFTTSLVKNVYFLNIMNVSKDDEATYICQSGSTYELNFTNATILVVTDPKKKENSIRVEQSPQSALVQVEESVRFRCSLLFKSDNPRVQCPGEHSVFLFRSGSGGSSPGVIYTHSHSIDEQDARSCVYSFSKTIKDPSENGTYYCAVATCGEILFGTGTKVCTSTGEELYPMVLAFGTLLGCSVIVIVVLILSRKQKAVCEHCNGARASNGGEWAGLAEDQPNLEDGEAVELNYVALDFPSRKRERWTDHRVTPEECVYSGMGGCQ